MTAILKVDTIQDTSGNNIINESSDTITIGASGDTVVVPSGGKLTAPGHVLQVVQGTKTAITSTTSNSFSATGVKATITPLSTSSKILVLVALNGVSGQGSTNRNVSFKLYKGGSFLDWIVAGYGYGTSIIIGNVSYNKLVSPSTTSATEFEVFFAEQGGTGGSVSINNYPSTADQVTSTITLMEIAGWL